MKVAAYCRVSTGSEEQLNSLTNQTAFFVEYAKKCGYELYRVFADRGISGKSSANRPMYLEMLKCAERKEFDMLLVKDISRFARNTVDFLNGIRNRMPRIPPRRDEKNTLVKFTVSSGYLS